jgi:molybdenum cofactor cytidylyltransferase
MNKLTQKAIIILAGGKSSRLGSPKQLLDVDGIPMLQRVIREAKRAAIGPVLVVTGAFTRELQSVIASEQVKQVHNPEWEEGMASSIRIGLDAIRKQMPELTSVFLLVSDQPFLRAELLQEMVLLQEKKNHPIVACAYGNTFGTPVFFQASLFDALQELKGDKGASILCRQYEQALGLVRFEDGVLDIDTWDDYEEFKNRWIC